MDDWPHFTEGRPYILVTVVSLIHHPWVNSSPMEKHIRVGRHRSFYTRVHACIQATTCCSLEVLGSIARKLGTVYRTGHGVLWDMPWKVAVWVVMVTIAWWWGYKSYSIKCIKRMMWFEVKEGWWCGPWKWAKLIFSITEVHSLLSHRSQLPTFWHEHYQEHNKCWGRKAKGQASITVTVKYYIIRHEDLPFDAFWNPIQGR